MNVCFRLLYPSGISQVMSGVMLVFFFFAMLRMCNKGLGSDEARGHARVESCCPRKRRTDEMSECVCVCVCEREREREYVCVYEESGKVWEEVQHASLDPPTYHTLFFSSSLFCGLFASAKRATSRVWNVHFQSFGGDIRQVKKRNEKQTYLWFFYVSTGITTDPVGTCKSERLLSWRSN